MTRKINSHIARSLMVFALFVLLLSAFPKKSEAAASTVYLGGVALINDNATHEWNNQGGTSISGWTAGSYRLSRDCSKLEITGMSFSGNTNGIYSEGPLKIVVSGNNSIECRGTGMLIYDSGGFGSLTLVNASDSSTDKLIIRGTGTSDAVSAGNCTITSVELLAICTADDAGAYFAGKLTMNSGSVNATNLSASSYTVTGGTITAENSLVANETTETTVISGGDVSVTKSACFQGLLELNSGFLIAASMDFYGGLTQTGGSLYSNKGDITVSYGNLNGTGGSLSSTKALHVTNGNMLISGTRIWVADGIADIKKDLKVSAGYLNVEKYGINVGGNVNVSGNGLIKSSIYDSEDTETYTSAAALDIRGKLITDGGEIQATTNSSGKNAIVVYGETDINNGTVMAKMTESSSNGFAATFHGPVYLQGGALIATGNSQSNSMLCSDNIQVNNNAVLQVNGGRGIGLQVNGEFALNSGTVSVSSTRGPALSASKVRMRGGKLTMDGGYGVPWHISNSLDLANDIWMSDPSDGKFLGASNYYYILDKDGDYPSSAVLQKVSSISVKTAPGGVLYSGDGYDAEQLVLNVKFADGAESDLSYATHTAMFDLNPAPTLALDAGTCRVSVGCLTKTTSFDVTVKQLGKPELSGTATTNSHRLSWSAAEGASWYELRGRKQGESAFRVLLSYNQSGYTNSGLSPGETWEYYVVAVRDNAQMDPAYGPGSRHLTLTALPDSPSISLSGSTYDSAVLEWDEAEGAVGYDVYRSEDGANFEKVAYVTETEFDDSGLVTGREYTYYVKSAIPDAGAYSAASNKARVTPAFTGETSLQVSNTGKYKLTWAAVSGATEYEIMRGNGADGSRTRIASTGGDSTSFTDGSADIYTVYNYTVVPVRTTAAGTFRGKESNAAVTTASEKPEPVPPDNEEPEGIFNLLQARSGKVTKTSIQIKWRKVPGAKKYILYGNKCGVKNKYKKLTVTTGSKITYKKVAGKKIRKGTYYKFVIYALDADGEVLSTSKVIHVATTGGKVGNDKSVKTAAKKNKVTLKKGKSFSLKAKAVPASKKLKVNRHRKVKYETSDRKIATVSSKGLIKARGKGTCYIYAYAQNGVFAKIKVTVK